MARSFPPKPNLNQLRIQAKDIVKAHDAGDAAVCDTLRRLQRFAKSLDADILSSSITLAEAQFALALDYGFASWDALKKVVTEGLRTPLWVNFSDDAQKVVFYAQEATGFDARNQVDLADLLYGMEKHHGSPASQILAAIRKAKPIDAADLAYQPDPCESEAAMTLGPRAKQAVNAASQEAVLLGHRFIGSQHLLLGVLKVLVPTGASAEDRLAFARDLVKRMPAIPEQAKNAREYEQRLAAAGGDRELLTVRTFAELIRQHHTREAIAEKSNGSITITIRNEVGEPFVQRGPSKEMTLLIDTVRTHLEPAIEYFANEVVRVDEARLKVIVVPPDESRPDVLLHVKIERVEG